MSEKLPTIHKSYKFRIKPTKKQIDILSKQFGGCRYVWNYFLGKRIKLYAEEGRLINYYDCAKELVELKKLSEWLKDTNAQSLQASLEDLDKAYQGFFKKRTKFPKFKSKHNSSQSYKVKQGVDIRGKVIKIPKLGNIKLHQDRQITGKILSGTISKNVAGQYFISLTAEQIVEKPNQIIIDNNKIVGVDLGIKTLAVLSNDHVIPNIKLIKLFARKLKLKQRTLKNKVKGSVRRDKAKLQIAKLHNHIANKRQDYLQKSTTKIVNENQVIILEDLAIKNMIKNHKLSKAIIDCSWSEFVRQLEYKAKWNNKITYKINRFFPSSKMCCKCQHINQNLTLADRIFNCQKCKNSIDRDVQASYNIKTFGLKNILNQTTCGKWECDDQGGYQQWQHNGINFLFSCETVANELINT